MDCDKKIIAALWNEVGFLLDKKYGFVKAGFPEYPRLFGRDSLIAAWQILPKRSEIARNTLEILAKFQGKKINTITGENPGKILHEHQIGKKEHPKGYFPFPYYGSVDSTPLFLILFYFYFQSKAPATAAFVKKYRQNILAAVNWMIEFGDKDGDYFLEYKREGKVGLYHQGWKDGFFNHLNIAAPVAIVEAQGYQYLALIGSAYLATAVFKDKVFAEKLLERAEKLKKAFNEKFWMEDKNYFALALDGGKKQRKAITSNPGHLLFTGICAKDKEKKIISRLFQKDLWTPYGIRTHSTQEQDFDPKSYHLGSVWPHDNWIIAQGLKKLGYDAKYQKIKKALLLAYNEIGFIPEAYGVSLGGKITIKGLKFQPCHPQGWATGALLNLLLYSR